MSAAAPLFAEQGFDGTTAEMIAEKAQANKAMINYYFRTKEGLYQEILDSVLGSMQAPLAELKSRNLPADEHLRNFIELFGSMNEAHPEISSMLLREIVSGGERITERVLPHFIRMMTYVRAILEDGMRTGTFRHVNPFCTHLSLVSSLIFFFASARARRRFISTGTIPAKEPLNAEYINHIQELFLRGLGALEEKRS